jgi:hypothetical protein
VLVDILIVLLLWHFQPQIQYPLFSLLFECFLQVVLHNPNDLSVLPKVPSVPVAIRLTFLLPLLACTPLGKELVEELDREHFNFIYLFEL